MKAAFPVVRMRRLRQHSALRDLIRESDVSLKDLICPLFVKGREGDKQPIASMPGLFQIPISRLSEEIEELRALGIASILLFGVPPHKDPVGSDSYHPEGIIQEAIQTIRKIAPKMLIVSDVCL